MQKETSQQIGTTIFLGSAGEVPPPCGVVTKPNEMAENMKAAGKEMDWISQHIFSALTSNSM